MGGVSSGVSKALPPIPVYTPRVGYPLPAPRGPAPVTPYTLEDILTEPYEWTGRVREDPEAPTTSTGKGLGVGGEGWGY